MAVEISSQRLADSEVGPQLAAGRDTVIFAVGTDRVLRRAPDPQRSFVVEAEAMEAIRAAGYPIPEVHRVGPGEMVLERIAGPTMLEDLGKHPWRLGAHARLLAELHTRLHALPAPAGLRPGPVPGECVLHLDLHPANVILSPGGPVVIDWANACVGAAGVDIAVTWLLLAVFDSDETGFMRVLVALLRKRLVRKFLAAAGRDAAVAVLPQVAEYRLTDRNVRPAERAAILALVAANPR